ncbi:peptidase M64 [candidate division KSB1 bacterium]|nr:peptidase M64 [candidate division KSB1 bacterium]
MRSTITIVGFVVMLFKSLFADGCFSFEQTLRIDYYRTGTSDQEIISLDACYVEGAWPGSCTCLIDSLDLGNNRVQVLDKSSGDLMFSSGYNTIFEEWSSTREARDGVFRTCHESVRFPLPRRPFTLVFKTRTSQGGFKTTAKFEIDPQSRWVNRESRPSGFIVHAIQNSGPAAEKVDLVFLGDGYRLDEMDKYHRDVERAVAALFFVEPFQRRQHDFNVWAVDVISSESGIDEPRSDRWRATALAASYNSLDSPRYVLPADNRAVRDCAAAAPYDAIAVLVNSPRYGGGGIYNQFAVSFTASQPPDPDWWCDYVFVHEFGHSFAGLGDEYYSSQVSYLDYYPPGVEPWEPNLTSLLDPQHVKWGDRILPGIPIPTPWEKAAYDSLGALVQTLQPGHPDYEARTAEMQSLLESAFYANRVGCFEGAGYAATGLYRPAINCRMFSKSLVPFCPVCQQAIERMIDTFVR